MKLLLFLIFIDFSTRFVNSYNYLLINPIFGFSHVKFISKIANLLADRGHNVTLFQPFHIPMKNLDGLVKNKNVEILNWYPSHFEEMEGKEVETFEFMWDSKIVTSPIAQALLFPKILVDAWKNASSELLRDKAILEKLKRKNFDAVLVETFEISGFYLAHFLEIPATISAMSTVRFPGDQELFGQSSPIGYAPAMGSKYGPEAGFMDRLNEIYKEIFARIFHIRMYEEQQAIYKNALGEDVKVPHWKDLITKSSLHLTNSNPYLDFAAPNVGTVIQIGGFTMDKDNNKKGKKVAKLPEEYETIMNERNQTVFISFGSMIRSYQMPDNFKSGIIQMFKNLPDVTFIWKYEEPEDVEFKKRLPPNAHLKKWVPQPAILADPRLSLFVTHGGLGSTMEVAYSGIAALMIPIFGDQPRNAAMLARHGGAISYDKFDLADSQKLTETIKEMITDSRYKNAAVQLQNVLFNQPIDPKDTLVKNMEFAVKFPKLKSQVPEINFAGYIGYYYIDVFAFLAIVFIVILCIFVKIVSSILRKFTNHLVSRKTKSE